MVFPLLPSAISLPDWERSATNYTAKTNLSVKVLDFVQLGGPILAVGSTIFEMWLGLVGSPRPAAAWL